jgi:hypothetical protein
LYDVTLILFCRVCGVQLVIPNGVVTKGIVPPYPTALRCVPINVFTYDVASFWAARPENGANVSMMMRPTANLFMSRNCISHANADAKVYYCSCDFPSGGPW